MHAIYMSDIRRRRSIRATDGRIDGGAFVRIRMRRVRISRNIDDLIRSMRPKLFKTLRLASSSVPLCPLYAFARRYVLFSV